MSILYKFSIYNNINHIKINKSNKHYLIENII